MGASGVCSLDSGRSNKSTELSLVNIYSLKKGRKADKAEARDRERMVLIQNELEHEHVHWSVKMSTYFSFGNRNTHLRLETTCDLKQPATRTKSITNAC